MRCRTSRPRSGRRRRRAGSCWSSMTSPAIVESLTKIFKREGMHVLTATDGTAGLDLLRKHRVGVLLTDLMMPQTTGMDLLRAAKTIAPETEVVLMTAYGTVETAVDAMKEGAYDFVTKPLKRAHVVRIVRNALEKQSLLVENRSLKAQLAEKRRRAIIGTSLAWRRTMDIVMQAAPSEATVLLLGESGTGKELLARALHDNSAARRQGPVRRGQLRRDPRVDPRGRAVRLREGRVHRRDHRARRPVRGRERRHAVPRRDRRDRAPRAGQAAARAAGGRDRAPRRQRQGAPDRRPHRRRDQRRPRRRGQGRPVPRGSVLPAQRDPGERAAAARSARRHPAARAALRPGLRREERQGDRGLLAGRARAPRPSTAGPATCASSRTPSSARSCSRAPARR